VGLGGRGFGTFITWFLLGGDLYTAYTFIAVPALVYGVGAVGFDLRKAVGLTSHDTGNLGSTPARARAVPSRHLKAALLGWRRDRGRLGT
jgi:hypothetical protein